jgi:hypothetical protein
MERNFLLVQQALGGGGGGGGQQTAVNFSKARQPSDIDLAELVCVTFPWYSMASVEEVGRFYHSLSREVRCTLVELTEQNFSITDYNLLSEVCKEFGAIFRTQFVHGLSFVLAI